MTADVVLAFAGDGEIAWEGAASLLDDLLEGFPKGAKIEAILPLTAATESATQALFVKFCNTVEIPYTVVTDGELLSKPQRQIWKNSADDRESEDPAHAVVSRLVAAAQADKTATLIVALGGELDEADELTAALIEEALDHDILVLDICAGLDDITFADDEPEPVEEEETVEADPETDPVEATPGEDGEPTPVMSVLAQDERELILHMTEVATKMLLRHGDTLTALGVLIGTQMFDVAIEDNDRALGMVRKVHYIAAAAAALEQAPVEAAPAVERSTSSRRARKPAGDSEPVKPRRAPVRQATTSTQEAPVKAPKVTSDEAFGQPRRTRKKEEGESDGVRVLELADGKQRPIKKGRRPAGSRVVTITQEAFDRLDLSS